MNRELKISVMVVALVAGLAWGKGLQGTDRVSDDLRPPSSRDVHSSHVTTTEVRNAIDLGASDVSSIDFVTSSHAGFDVFNTAATLFPVKGSDYLVMSTGDTASALTPNSSGSTSTELSGLNTAEGNDLVQIVLVLNPPTGASCLAFDFAFYSEEFPEYVGSQYNDVFIAEIGQSTFQQVNNQIIAPNNFAFDTLGNVVSVNTVFGVTGGAADGTTYDGGTPLLTAVTPLENDVDPVTITLSIMDLGDSIYDSTAFIDNFRWFFGLACEPGADADSDGDALLDDWETNGIDYDNDGVVDLDLPAMGADPQHKDIFVEIDYMVLSGAGGHTHKPKADALQIVIDAFDTAPVTNPDGTTGIHIHIDAGSDTIMDPVTNALWGSRSESDALAHQANLGTTTASPQCRYQWTAFDALKGVGTAGNFSVLRADVFHYCIFAHNLASTPCNMGSTSGIARDIPSSDFIVSLGGWTGSVGTVNQQAGTLMHELGHNLGLFHGGDDPAGNYEPNYLSIMNYAFQTRGLRISGADGNFDYSRFQLPGLNENTLDETQGIISGLAEAANYGTRFYDLTGVQRIVDDINAAIDWNQDGDNGMDSSVAVDINGTGISKGPGLCSISGAACFNNSHCGTGGGTCQALTLLNNTDNWDEIIFNGGAVGQLGEMVILPDETDSIEIDEEEDLEIPTDFSVRISGPGSVGLEVCQTDTYEFTIQNTSDNPDTYTITHTAIQSWVDRDPLPASLSLDSGESARFNLPVTIPPDALTGAMDLLLITVESDSNPLMADVSETKTTIVFPGDRDGDGYTDFCDACPDSDTRETIIIDGCDSGARNHLFEDGCTMADHIAAAAAAAENHGKFAIAVSELTNQWKKAGLISGQDKGWIEKCAAGANLP